jgi:hypothetical protein
MARAPHRFACLVMAATLGLDPAWASVPARVPPPATPLFACEAIPGRDLLVSPMIEIRRQAARVRQTLNIWTRPNGKGAHAAREPQALTDATLDRWAIGNNPLKRWLSRHRALGIVVLEQAGLKTLHRSRWSSFWSGRGPAVLAVYLGALTVHVPLQSESFSCSWTLFWGLFGSVWVKRQAEFVRDHGPQLALAVAVRAFGTLLFNVTIIATGILLRMFLGPLDRGVWLDFALLVPLVGFVGVTVVHLGLNRLLPPEYQFTRGRRSSLRLIPKRSPLVKKTSSRSRVQPAYAKAEFKSLLAERIRTLRAMRAIEMKTARSIPGLGAMKDIEVGRQGVTCAAAEQLSALLGVRLSTLVDIGTPLPSLRETPTVLDLKALPDVIRERVKASGLTMQQYAAKMGWHETAVHGELKRIAMRALRPKLLTLYQFAAPLGLSTADLIRLLERFPGSTRRPPGIATFRPVRDIRRCA